MSSVSIIHAPRDEALGARIAAALESAGHAAMRISADPDVGDLDAAQADEGAAIVVWTAAAAKLAKLRDQAREAMERGALIPVAVGRVRPPGGFEKLPPVDLSGWTGAVDDPRWRFVLEEVTLAHQRTLLRDGEVWADPENENETGSGGEAATQPSEGLAAEEEPAPERAAKPDRQRPPAAWIDLDNEDEDGDADAFPGALRQPQRRRRGFTARQVAMGASGGLVLMTAAAALLLPVLLPAPKPVARPADLREAPLAAPIAQQETAREEIAGPEDAVIPDPSPATPSTLATLRPGAAPELELPLAAAMPVGPETAREDAAAFAADTLADAAAETAAEESGDDALETLIASLSEETSAGTAAEADSEAAAMAPALGPAAQEAAEGANFGAYFRECLECPDMAALPPGSFRMVSAPETGGEGFSREVVIDRRFAIGAREVTFAQWDACVAAGGCASSPSDRGWGRGRQPVTGVSYDDAVAYANWLSLKTGQPYRLPTEAEWEYAARAGSPGPFASGDTISVSHANFNGQLPHDGPAGLFRGRTTPTASFAPNAFGLYDMHGNAREWTGDCWNASRAAAPADGSAAATGDCTRRVLKGGAWNSAAGELRADHRMARTIWSREPDSGFRVARDMN